MEEEVEEEEGEEEEEEEGESSQATLTQLVRLIKRVCGLWVRAQTHQETARPMTPLRWRNIVLSSNNVEEDRATSITKLTAGHLD